MPLQIIRNDITKMHCDAIVNAANPSLLGGGGVDGAIHAAAGPQLLEECRSLGGCLPGQAKLTGGYRLPAKYIIHTVGPIWQGGHLGEAQTLAACYRNCLDLAYRSGLMTVAFPLISAGAYGYPREEALQIATHTISEFLLHAEMMVWLVVYDRETFQISKDRMAQIAEYIDQQYVDDHFQFRNRRDVFAEAMSMPSMPPVASKPFKQILRQEKAATYSMDTRLEDLLEQVDESFSQMLLRKIDEKGITDTQCYKKANIDRKLFSKIRKDIHYKPKKVTAIAFAIALELSLEETRDLLQKAGFALSHSNKFDIIIEYFIRRGIYDIYEINEALFAFDQVLLGG